MVRILEAADALPAGGVLRARTDRRPMHLYPLLEERGFTAETQPEADGSFLTFIRWREGLPAPSAGGSSSLPTMNP